ncbi:hypothetical protein K2173_005179 [Erythroxylum novogranatense]|uniref:RING-type domain-containing protein n=1 Tax=Erythroxylum novogranatense TaxID=1862640 RepID=A0AAV8TSW7_9ROSI|nr:hypothetical protein K2173_005179 [Erythroxylum novogranatense]
MALALSESFSHFFTMTLLFFTLLLLELVKLCRSFMGGENNSDNRTLTTAQYVNLIEQEYPALSYVEGLRQQQRAAECAVCLSEFCDGESVRKLRCQHVFHKDCLDKWLQQCLATCPLCRGKVLADEAVNGYRRQQNLVVFEDSEDERLYMVSDFLNGNNLYWMF